MSKKTTTKDFYREIKKSPGRFLSIFFIVVMGVAFFAGIRATEPSMQMTGDSYFDGANLMDIKVLSIYGITEDDVETLAEVEGVERAVGTYSADFIHETDNQQDVLHVMSLKEGVNDIAVYEGRLPEKVGECLADSETAYQIGDVITLTSGSSEDVEDRFKTTELTVVGRGSSPCYISYGRGSATIGNGKVKGFLIVPEESFDMEVYTEAYVYVEGAKDMQAFADEYEEAVDKVLKNVEEHSEERVQIRKQEIIDEAYEELNDAKEEYAEEKQEVEAELADARRELEDAQRELDNAKQEIIDGKEELKNGESTLKAKEKELEDAKESRKRGLKQLEAGKKAYKDALKKFESEKPAAEKKINEAKKEINMLLSVIQACKKELENLIAQNADPESIQELERDIAAMEKTYQQAVQTLNAAEAELAAAEKKLKDTKKQLDANEKKLKEAKKQIEAGEKQIEAGWKELEANKKKLAEGEQQIPSNERKLKDGWAEYREAEAEARKEFAEVEEDLKEAEEEIEDIKEPKWYVYDRSTLAEYSSFGENAERIGAIGKVFPWLFFLVAALISLTNMTRMVEEQRINIGTMKALGYSRYNIAAKYIGYAMLATVGGSILGVLIGEKLLPYIIIYAYGILYHHIPEILMPYEFKFAALASFTAIFFVLFATVSACYKELRSQPAVLMRPPAPKNGKRIFLERIGFIWNHMNFTWKSTFRNLSRYKKRFFMTVFGISGCMALIVIGFGLRDSIYEIAELQFEDVQTYDGSIYLEEDLNWEEKNELYHYLDGDGDIVRYIDANMKSVTLMHGKHEYESYECVFNTEDAYDEYIHLRDRKTQEPYELTDDGVIISEKIAKLLDVQVGDEISIKDEENGNKKVVISNICENYMGHYIYFSAEYYDEVYRARPEYNCIMFKMTEDYDKEQIEAAGKDIMNQEEVLSISYTHDIQKRLDDMLGSLNLVMIVLIIAAGLLAFVVLYNLNTVNITERQRELATLKVLGFYNSEVASYVYRENIILTLIGTLVGVLLGKVLHLYIIQTIEVDTAMFGRIIKVSSYIFSIIITFAFSMLVNGIMYFKLKKINMVESLKSIE